MSPEASTAIARARECLDKAQVMVDALTADEAGRPSDIAGLNAARAYIVERIAKVSKTHSVSHSAFSRPAKGNARFERWQRSFLTGTYGLKTTANYGDPAAPISLTAASDVMVRATKFIDAIEAAIHAEPWEG